jgi:hypothetical protein
MVSQAIGTHRSQRCFMRDSQVTLDMDGTYSVCCVESPSSPRLGNYLEDSYIDMQKKRVSSDLCAKCTAKGINIFATYAYEEPPEIQEAIRSCLPFDLNLLLEPPSAGSKAASNPT